MSLPGNHLVAYFLGASFILLFWRLLERRRNAGKLPLPPGPRPLPLIGNLLDLPTDHEWLVYDEWFKKYGNIIHISVLGQPMIILGSAEMGNDLLEKRSTYYSDRIELRMLNDLMGWTWNMALQRYGSWWRRHRKAFHQHFNGQVVAKYHPHQLNEAHAFLRRLLDTPENFLHHVRHTFSSLIMNVVYGIQIAEEDDRYVTVASEALESLAIAATPGTFLVDLIPALKYVPAWFPFAGFQRKAAYWRSVSDEFQNRPFNVVKSSMERGTAPPSVLFNLLSALPDGEERAEEEVIARDVATVAYAGGADTTVSSVQSFFMAMAMYPEVQAKAQAELDTVVGGQRLPTFEDREELPYIVATVKEVNRWQPAFPSGFAHASTVEDEYNGYRIPKGAVVACNTWTVLHDPKDYPEPLEFNPDRFIKNGKLDPSVRDPVAAFGFGRRLCPGKHLSDNSLFAMVSSVLSVFDITPAMDDSGQPISIKPEMTNGKISHPLPFRCTIKPRSKTTEALIRDTAV